jgi:hypothetical protein
MAEFIGSGAPLSREGLAEASDSLGVGLPELWAVLAVETRGCGFLPDRRPKILFERHVFHRRTSGRFGVKAPDLSFAEAGGYGEDGAPQYGRLTRAIVFDRTAALESASWGISQVMGFNFGLVGFSNVEEMVSKMVSSEDAQLGAMSAYCHSAGLAAALKARDWRKFARGYNGEQFEKNKYDSKLAERHAHYLANGVPDIDLRTAQVFLHYLGFQPGLVDGELGPLTSLALKRFQAREHISETGQLDSQTFDKLKTAAAISDGTLRAGV